MLLTLGRRAPSPDRSLGYQCLCGAASLPWLRWWWFFWRPAMQPATEGRGAAVNQPYQRWTPREWMRCRAVSYQHHLILPLRRWLNRSQRSAVAQFIYRPRCMIYIHWTRPLPVHTGSGGFLFIPGGKFRGQLSWAPGDGAPGVASLAGTLLVLLIVLEICTYYLLNFKRSASCHCMTNE